MQRRHAGLVVDSLGQLDTLAREARAVVDALNTARIELDKLRKELPSEPLALSVAHTIVGHTYYRLIRALDATKQGHA